MQYEPYVVLYASDKWSSLEQQNTNYDVPIAQAPKEKLELPTPVVPSDTNKTKSFDYSSKTKSELIQFVKRWKKEGKTRREISELLYKKEYENGFIKPSSIMKRVDRLK